jgi:hypothetical protein
MQASRVAGSLNRDIALARPEPINVCHVAGGTGHPQVLRRPRAVLDGAESIQRRGIEAVFAPFPISGLVTLLRKVQHTTFLTATQCASCLQLAE